MFSGSLGLGPRLPRDAKRQLSYMSKVCAKIVLTKKLRKLRKKIVNSHNSIKGPKDPNCAKNVKKKITSISKMCQKITPKRAKLQPNSLLRQTA